MDLFFSILFEHFVQRRNKKICENQTQSFDFILLEGIIIYLHGISFGRSQQSHTQNKASQA